MHHPADRYPSHEQAVQSSHAMPEAPQVVSAQETIVSPYHDSLHHKLKGMDPLGVQLFNDDTAMILQTAGLMGLKPPTILATEMLEAPQIDYHEIFTAGFGEAAKGIGAEEFDGKVAQYSDLITEIDNNADPAQKVELLGNFSSDVEKAIAVGVLPESFTRNRLNEIQPGDIRFANPLQLASYHAEGYVDRVEGRRPVVNLRMSSIVPRDELARAGIDERIIQRHTEVAYHEFGHATYKGFKNTFLNEGVVSIFARITGAVDPKAEKAASAEHSPIRNIEQRVVLALVEESGGQLSLDDFLDAFADEKDGSAEDDLKTKIGDVYGDPNFVDSLSDQVTARKAGGAKDMTFHDEVVGSIVQRIRFTRNIKQLHRGMEVSNT